MPSKLLARRSHSHLLARPRRRSQALRSRCVVAGLAAAWLLAATGGLFSAPAEADSKTRPLGGGAWSWFGDPRGIHHRGAFNRTYVGWIDRQGDVKVASYDHATRLRTTAVLRWGLQADDHDNPSLHVLPDGRLIAFYSRHSGNEMYYRVSHRPESVTAWGRERTIPTNTRGGKGYTYPNPIQLSGERNRLWLFWRGGNYQPSFSTSRDSGATWAKARTLVNQPDQRPYVKFASNRTDKIHFAFTQGHPKLVNSNIYYARYRGGALYRANGEKIKSTANLPLSPREADKVYDSRHKAWIHDIALDHSGRPVLVFATFDSPSNHHYHYARWTGTEWERRRITAAGGSIAADNSDEPFYSGGISLDHENPSVVYLSREVDGMHEVETWRTPDRGATWTRQAVTSGSGVENVRPIAPRGLRSFDDDMSVVWMRGTYEHWLNYRTNITTRLLNGGNIPPVSEARAGPRSGEAPLAVRFDGTRSRDSDGSIAKWSWNFGDGRQGTGRTASHTYRKPGRYFVKLTVTDEAGDRDAFVTEVIVG